MDALLLSTLHGVGFLCLGAMLAFLGIFFVGSRHQETSSGEGCLTFILCALLVLVAVVIFMTTGPVAASLALQ
jgi:hypothetical protein